MSNWCPTESGQRSGGDLSARQQEVLDALEAIFLRSGLELSVAELARQVGCSRRTLYELAASKPQLLELVFDRMLHRLGRAARAAAAAESAPAAQIDAYLRTGVIAFAPVRPAFVAAMRDGGPAGRVFDRHLGLARGFLVRTVDEGIAIGHFRPLHAPLAAEALLAAVRALTRSDAVDPNGVDTASALAELSRLFLDGLLR